jgi:hypothetical protein
MGTGGSAMHRVTAPVAEALYYGWDADSLVLRVDFAGGTPPGEDASLVIELASPVARRFRVDGLAPFAAKSVRAEDGAEAGRAALEDVLELALPFASLDAGPGVTLELLLHVERGGERLESLPPGQLLRVEVPGPEWDAANWSA